MDDKLQELINNYHNYYWEQDYQGSAIRLGKAIEGNIEFSYIPNIDKYQIEIRAFTGDSDGDTQLRSPQQYSIATNTGKLIKELLDKLIPILNQTQYISDRDNTAMINLLPKTKIFLRTNF